MNYDVNKLPDFYSVRNTEQIDYSFENMQDKRCYCFFDNGFASNVIEPNKRDIRFIWDGFILFTDKDVTLEDLQQGINLYESRLVALQRTNLQGQKSNSEDIRSYILAKLTSQNIPFAIMPDTRLVDGYPSKSDLWSTRDSSVLLDAIDCTGVGRAYYFKNKEFKYEITFNKSGIPTFSYSHHGALVLRGEDSIAISRLLCNDSELFKYLENLIGSDKVYSYLEGKFLPGTTISNIETQLKKQ